MTVNERNAIVRRWLAGALAGPVLLVNAARAQTPAPVSLSLGDAAQLAAKQGATAMAARYRAEQADARVTQRKAELLPNVTASALENGRTLNTATFGIDFPT